MTRHAVSIASGQNLIGVKAGVLELCAVVTSDVLDLDAIYAETLLTWQSDICSIFHMVSTFHCITSNLVKCLFLVYTS